MYRGKRYIKAKKRYINFFLFYIAVAIVMFAGYTFSRYTTTVSTDESIVGVAKFNVKVNNEYVGTDRPFQLQLSTNNNTYKNKIAPDVKDAYFEIIIDPTGTEVSLEYEFNFNLEAITQNISIISYAVNAGQKMTVEDNIIKGDIILPSNEKGFETKDVVNIKVYWEWNEDIINPTITNDSMSVTSIIKQKIN